jgi:ADP-ribose pyrophosphatase
MGAENLYISGSYFLFCVWSFKLKSPPSIKIHQIENTIEPKKGFLRVQRTKGYFEYPNQTKSEEFVFDTILRESVDAVVIVPYCIDPITKIIYIYLRSCVRPALSIYDWKGSEEEGVGNMYELPAGMVDAGEDLASAASRELMEEVGFKLKPEEMKLLGYRIFPSAGTFAERLTFYYAEVDPSTQSTPTLDGSPFELHGEVIKISLVKALWLIESGELPDAKTEIGLVRLKKILKA